MYFFSDFTFYKAKALFLDERKQKKESKFKQEAHNFHVTENTIQRNFHSSPQASPQADVATDGRSIIKPLSEFHYASDRTAELEYDNSVREARRNNNSKESLIKSLIDNQPRSDLSTRNLVQVWNDYSIKFQYPTVEKSIQNSSETANGNFKKNLSGQFWREVNVPWRRLRRSPHRLSNDDLDVPAVAKLQSMPNLMGNGANGILPPAIPTSESSIVTVS